MNLHQLELIMEIDYGLQIRIDIYIVIFNSLSIHEIFYVMDL